MGNMLRKGRVADISLGLKIGIGYDIIEVVCGWGGCGSGGGGWLRIGRG